MYREEELLESRSLRARLSHRAQILGEVKPLPLLPDGEHVTAAIVAEYFEVDSVLAGRVVRKNREELETCGYRQLRGPDLKDFLGTNLPGRKLTGAAMGVFSARAVLVLAMLLRESGIAQRIRRRLLGDEAGVPVLAHPSLLPVAGELAGVVAVGGPNGSAERTWMARTLAEAIGRPADIAALGQDIGQDTGEDIGVEIMVMSDGSVHCRHGTMKLCVPGETGEYSPPSGPYYRCPEAERYGIRSSRQLYPCGTITLVDVVRHLAGDGDGSGGGAAQLPPYVTVPAQRAAGSEAVGTNSMFLAIGDARVHGTARQIAEMLRELGVVVQ